MMGADQVLGKNELIERLQLVPLDEGGYFRQLHESRERIWLGDREGGDRPVLNTIHYLLTDDSPIGHLHRNRSDIVHFFHCGSPLEYVLVTPDGELERRILGPDLGAGHVFQMTVPGGYWKATRLLGGEFGLLSEAVAPGFDYRDRDLATAEHVQTLFPQLWDTLAPYIPT